MKKKMMASTAISVVFAALFLFSSVHSFYLPGVAPRDFQIGDPLSVKVNKLSSTKTQLPYDYYFLKYCEPSKILNNAENLGEVLRGDRIENSVYAFQMRKEQSCTVVCHKTLEAESAKSFKEKIDDEYRVNMILDNLPVAVRRQRRDGSQSTTYEHGFRVGFKFSCNFLWFNAYNKMTLFQFNCDQTTLSIIKESESTRRGVFFGKRFQSSYNFGIILFSRKVVLIFTQLLLLGPKGTLIVFFYYINATRYYSASSRSNF